MAGTKRRYFLVGICAVLMLGIALAWRLCHPPALYRVTVLPSLDGQPIMPCAINERGQVVGLVRVRRVFRLFLWDRAGGTRNLGIECGGGVDINNSGQIVTTAIDPNGIHQAVLWDPISGARIIGPPGVNSVAHAINNLGQVVGAFEASPKVWHAFIWDEIGEMRDLGQGSVRAINDAGQVIVSSNNGDLIVEASGGDVTRGLQVRVGGLVTINNQGWVSGLSSLSVARSGKVNVAMWHPPSTLKVLAQIDARDWSQLAINDANQVLITSEHPETRVLGKRILPARRQCCVHDPHRGLISLDRYLLRAGPGIPSVMDLNNQGRIIGEVRSRDGLQSTAVLLEPVPKRWKKREAIADRQP